MKIRHVLIIISFVMLLIIIWLISSMSYFTGVNYGEQNAEQIRKDRLIESKQDTILPKYINTEVVISKTAPFTVKSYGRVVSTTNVNISSEVQGMLISIIPLKKGAKFSKGQTLFKIKDTDIQLALIAKKSNYLSLITNCLPDLKIDYPDEYDKWAMFFNSIKVNALLPKIPDFNNIKEKNFIISKNILSEYYSIKSDEAHLSKYLINAHFDGSIIASFADDGAIVNPGATVINVIRKGKLEIEIPFPPKHIDKIKKGSQVMLSDSEDRYEGTISRIGEFVNPNTQNISVFVKINSENTLLYNGMYLETLVFCDSIEDVTVIPRRALFGNKKIYTVNKDNLLIPIEIEIRTINEKTVTVKGLPNYTRIVTEPIINAKDSMKVSVNNKETDKLPNQ